MGVLEFAVGGWFARAVSVAVRLGIPDVLAEKPLSKQEIMRRLDADPVVFARLLKMLTVPGVLRCDSNDEFTLNEDFAQLRADHPRTLRHAFLLLAETYDDAWGGLMHTVRTGESGFERVFGMSLYDYLDTDDGAGRLFDQAMADLARPVAAELVGNHDFSGIGTVVDVGGGAGALLRGILTAHPDLRGVVADRATVCERGAGQVRLSGDADVAARLSFECLDFFEKVPAGGDRYLLKNVLHDWTDENRVRILRTIARAMRGVGDARLLVIEPLVESDGDSWRDLVQMLICDRGMAGLDEARTRVVLGTAGFDVVSTVRLATEHTVFECAPRSD